MAVDVHRSPNVSFETPRTVLDQQRVANLRDRCGVSPDGQRFLFAENATFARSRSLVFVLNRTEESKRLVPVDD